MSTLVAPGPRTPEQQVTSKLAPSSPLGAVSGGSFHSSLGVRSPCGLLQQELGPSSSPGHLKGICWRGWGGTGSFPLRPPPPAPWPDARSFQGVTLLRGLLLSALLGKTLGEIYSEFMALAAVLWSKEGQEGTVLGCRTTCSSPSSRPPAPPSGPDRPDEVREARLVF